MSSSVYSYYQAQMETAVLSAANIDYALSTLFAAARSDVKVDDYVATVLSKYTDLHQDAQNRITALVRVQSVPRDVGAAFVQKLS